ncbi:hypothetical protein UT300009_30220 [Paraclostridium bifermentans]
MSKKYGVNHRTIFNKETKEMRNVYSPVIYINGKELFVSDGGEILEFNYREYALECAKKTYLKHKEKLMKEN